MEGWKGKLLGLGLRVMGQPELLDVSGEVEVGAGEPFVWIDKVVLEEGGIQFVREALSGI